MLLLIIATFSGLDYYPVINLGALHISPFNSHHKPCDEDY